MQRTQEILVNDHCLVIALVGKLHLVYETVLLVDWIVELRVCVGKLLAVYHQLEALCKTWFRTVHLCQRRHLHGIVCDECRLDECSFAELSEEFVDEFSLAECLVDFHSLFKAERTDFLFCLSVAVETCFLLDGVKDRQAAVWSLEAHHLAVYFPFRRTVHCYTDCLEEFLCECHHPVVVLVLHVELHTCELWIVVAVHSLVPEVLSDFINTFKTAYYKPLQIQLCGNTHIHILVEGVEMSDERSC